LHPWQLRRAGVVPPYRQIKPRTEAFFSVCLPYFWQTNSVPTSPTWQPDNWRLRQTFTALFVTKQDVTSIFKNECVNLLRMFSRTNATLRSH
jgi:hypothetical protein